jgi:Transposase DDE domain group 1
VVTASHYLDRLSVTFDDPNLVANAGLVLPGTLAQRLDAERVIDRRVDLSGRVGGANAGIKAMTVISALLAGAECIDDVDVLRAGSSDTVCGHEVRAPSTIGVWLRAFTWGHVRQLEAAAGEILAAGWAAGGGPASGEPLVIDLDSTFCQTYGLDKQGGWKVNRDGQRGYHPLVAVVDGYDQIAATRLREGPANDARGAGRFTIEALARVRAAGADGPVTVRADAGFYAHPVIAACRTRRVRFSVTVRLNPWLQRAIDGIDEAAWTDIPADQWAPNDGVAQVAETRLPGAFADDDEPVRLVVRRVHPKAAKPGEDRQLLPNWRYHAFITDRWAGTTLEADRWHRAHAQIENVIKDLKGHGGLAHLPSGVFAANAAWLTLVVIAYNLGRQTLLLGEGIDSHASNKTLRRRLLAWPARIARHARQVTLHAPADWPWADAIAGMLTRLRAIPAPP